MKTLDIVLHCHSTWSYDGSWSLSGIARLFGALGYDAVMMSEHDTGFDPARFGAYRAACAAASTSRCTLIPGIEYSSPDNDIHILTWGLDQFLAEHRPVAETLAKVRDGAGVAIFAHPVRRDAWRKYDDGWTELLSAIEIWNRKSDGLAPSKHALELHNRTRLPATVGMDFHRKNQIWSLGNRVQVHDTELLEGQLVAAIAEGRLSPRSFGRDLLVNGQDLCPVAIERARRHEAWRQTLRQRLRLKR